MPPQQPHLSTDRVTNIPSRVQQEMDRHLQQTLPGDLKYYHSSGDYVPPHIQQQLTQHMEQSMPEHLKQYIGPYMQQRVVSEQTSAAQALPQPQFTPGRTTTYVPDRLTVPTYQAQPTVQPQATPQTQIPPQPAAGPEPTSPTQEPYGFITNTPPPVKTSFSLFGGRSLAIRLAIIGGGLIALLIVFTIFKGLLGGGFNLPPFVTVLQDQQELIHLSSAALQPQNGQTTLSVSDQNFVATTQVSMTSAQTQLKTYLTQNNQKVPPNQLTLRVSTTTDSQLTSAQAAGNYTAVFQQVMSNELNTYGSDLRQAFIKTPGKKGRALLSSDYAQAVLLLKQLNQAGSSGN